MELKKDTIDDCLGLLAFCGLLGWPTQGQASFGQIFNRRSIVINFFVPAHLLMSVSRFDMAL